jgi:hypothetical protein
MTECPSSQGSACKAGYAGASPASVSMESEPVREPGLAANECAPAGVAFESSALRLGMVDREGRCPAGNREPRRESCAGSIPAPSAMERQADWRRHLPRKQASTGRCLGGPTPPLSALDALADWRRHPA